MSVLVERKSAVKGARRVILKQEDIHRGNLILVNRAYGLQEPETVGRKEGEKLLPVRDGEAVFLRQRAVILLQSIMEKLHGWTDIVPVSGFRSMEEQQNIWRDSLAENGLEFTEKFVAFPGHSEHQTGLAIDLGLKKEEIDFICPDFPYSGICQRFRETAVDYGFIERYPKGKENVTGIGHEPWHFRYVGAPHAAVMKELGMVLEEYVEFLKGYAFGENPLLCRIGGRLTEISYLPWLGRNVEIELEEGSPFSVSGNNADGYIFTRWRY